MGNPMLGRDAYIEIIEHRYFGSMARGEVQPILDLFHDDGQLNGYCGSDRVRLVRRRPAAGEESLESFLSALRSDFELTYGQFVHFVDAGAERSACTFRLTITPRRDGARADHPVRELRNCNFFQFDRGRIRSVVAYFSMPPEDVAQWPAGAAP
jgi:ketosteroid isomerase-like protein